MVMRQSEQVQLQQPGPKQIQYGTGGGVVRPDYAKHVSGDTASERLAKKLAEAGSALAGQAFQVQTEEKYLAGVAAASVGKAETDLEGNLITGDWERAGYRDTVGRLSMAESQSKILADMPTLVQKTPAEFKKYLEDVRAPLVESLNGMSRQQRAAAFGQMAQDMAAAGKRYEVGRAKWIIDQKAGAIQASMTARRASMEAAKDDLSLYETEVDGFVSNLYKDVWSDPSLPLANKIELTRQAAEFASSADNTMVYDKLQSMRFEFADGKTGTLMERLPFEDQIKVDKAQRAAMDRVKSSRAADFETQVAIWQAEWSDPDVGVNQTFEEVGALLDQAEHAKLLSPGKRESVIKAWATATARNNGNANVAAAYANGDVQALTRYGKDQRKGLDAYMKTIRLEPLDKQVSNLLTIGANNGMDSALNKAGELLGPAVATMGMSDNIDPNNAALVSNVGQALQQAEKSNPGAHARFLSGMSSEQQSMFMYLDAAREQGVNDPVAAIKWARAQTLQDSQAGGVRSQRIAENNKADGEALAEITERQLLGTISSKFSFFNDAVNRDQLRTGRAWFEDESRVNEVMAQTQMAYAQELEHISRTNPFQTDKSRKSMALASVAARTVDTESGPLTMPRGQSLQSFFGVPQYADKELVGQAIDQLYKPADGNRIAWTNAGDNTLIMREFSKDGRVVKSASINPRQVAPKVQELLDAEAQDANKTQGAGVVHKSKDGAQVQFNGLNSAGIDPSSMLKLRQDIVASEGVRDTAYADSGGKSFGVGIHQSNNHYRMAGPTGVYSQAEINESFNLASNDAARAAVRTMKSIGVEGEDFVRFFGELNYQSPKSARDPDLLAYISLGDKAGAIKALQETNAYKGSHPARRAQYVARLSAAMR